MLDYYRKKNPDQVFTWDAFWSLVVEALRADYRWGLPIEYIYGEH